MDILAVYRSSYRNRISPANRNLHIRMLTHSYQNLLSKHTNDYYTITILLIVIGFQIIWPLDVLKSGFQRTMLLCFYLVSVTERQRANQIKEKRAFYFTTSFFFPGKYQIAQPHEPDHTDPHPHKHSLLASTDKNIFRYFRFHSIF